MSGESSVCVMCLKYRIIIYFKHITRTAVIIADYKCMGYVIIPGPNRSGREGINSVAVMIAVVAVQMVAVSMSRWR